MDIWRSLNGMVLAEVTSADVPGILTILNGAGVSVFKTVSKNDLTVHILLRRQDLKAVRNILQRRGDSIRLLRRLGSYWTMKRLLKRPVMILGVLLLFMLSCFVPTRIWFFRVDGNVSIPDKLILEQASACGISFGVSRREVRSEKMKNALLEALPQLQWAGINTSGCVATISVRERQKGIKSQQSGGVCSIVAACDGLIQSYTVTRGNAVCAVGQAVKAGQLLISGYTDCGLSIRACRAEGEVIARTERSISAIMPTDYAMKGNNDRQIKKYTLLIGKKRINFYKDSGILDSSCDKMVSAKSLTLPGGFVLPVSLVTETWVYRDRSTGTMDQEQLEHQLADFAADYLRGQMIAGEILSAEETFTPEVGFVLLEGKYSCQEMIGRIQTEEIIKPNE